MEFKIEPGRFYRMRNNEKAFVGYKSPSDAQYPWRGEHGLVCFGWTEDGMYRKDRAQSNFDIVAEWTDAPPKPAEVWVNQWRDCWGPAYDSPAGAQRQVVMHPCGEKPLRSCVRFVEAEPLEAEIAKLRAEQSKPLARGPAAYQEPWFIADNVYRDTSGVRREWGSNVHNRVCLCVNALAGFTDDQVAAMAKEVK